MSHTGRESLPDGGDEATLGGFGCPMLVRGHAIVRVGQRPLVRCSFGWALRGEREIERCMATDTSERCWKASEDNGALHEAAFVASRAPKRRAVSGVTCQDADADQTAETAEPVIVPLRPVANRRRSGTVDRARERQDLASPAFTPPDSVAADH